MSPQGCKNYSPSTERHSERHDAVYLIKHKQVNIEIKQDFALVFSRLLISLCNRCTHSPHPHCTQKPVNTNGNKLFDIVLDDSTTMFNETISAQKSSSLFNIKQDAGYDAALTA
jgi:hypothetical protein